jgi:hypothetical protein
MRRLMRMEVIAAPAKSRCTRLSRRSRGREPLRSMVGMVASVVVTAVTRFLALRCGAG